MKGLSILFFLLIASLTKCGTSNPLPVLTFGSGGGFAGREVLYKIDSDGTLQQITSGPNAQKKKYDLNENDKKQIAKAYASIDTIAAFDLPGNVYYEMEVNNKKYVWGDPGYAAPTPIIRMYNVLDSLTKSIR